MEESKAYSSATDDLHTDGLRVRNIPNDQEDVDFVMKHFNDPNFDLAPPPSFISDVEESDRYSTSRGDFRGPTAMDFDESLSFFTSLFAFLTIPIANRHTLKCEPLWLMLTIP